MLYKCLHVHISIAELHDSKFEILNEFKGYDNIFLSKQSVGPNH